MSNLFDVAMSMRWAILPEALEQLFRVIDRDFKPEDLSRAMHGNELAMKYIGEDGKFKPEMLETIPGDPLPGTRNTKVRDGVAIIPIIGPIFPRANLFTEWSGAVNLSQVALDFNTALNSDTVHSIVIKFDTPGGQITGISEFAQMIFDAGCKRGKRKALFGFGEGLVASAGMWIASALDRLFITNTSALGSIGVAVAYLDTSKRDEARGVKEIEIISSQSPKKRANPTTDTGRAEIQRVVDDLADVFIKEVARFRDVTAEEVAEKFGEGGLIIGQKAIDRNMADELGSLESVIQFAIDNDDSSQSNGGFFMNAKEQKPEVTMSYEAVKESAPEVFTKIRDEGIAAGSEAERNRIKGIMEIKAPGHENIVNEQLFKPEATKESVSALILDAQQTAREKTKKDTETDAKEVATESEGVEGGGKATDEQEKAAAVAAMVAGANGTQVAQK